MNYPDHHLSSQWITNGIDEKAIEWAESFGKHLAEKDKMKNLDPITSSQIRRFYGELMRIYTGGVFCSDIALLKPKLAYAVARDRKKDGSNKTKIIHFYEEIILALSFIRKNSFEDFRNFIKLSEAILAYYKYYGGED